MQLYESILAPPENSLRDMDSIYSPMGRFGVFNILVDNVFVKFVDTCIDKFSLVANTSNIDINYWQNKIFVSELEHSKRNHILGIMLLDNAEIYIRLVYYICQELLDKQELVSNRKLDLSNILSYDNPPEVRVYKFTGVQSRDTIYNILLNVESGGQLQIQYRNNIK